MPSKKKAKGKVAAPKVDPEIAEVDSLIAEAERKKVRLEGRAKRLATSILLLEGRLETLGQLRGRLGGK